MAEDSSAPYWFSAFPFPPGHFRVHRVRGNEALSKPYRFDVTVTASTFLGDNIERLSIGHRASLVIRVGTTPRVITGVIESVSAHGLRESGKLSQTTFRLVPMVALLRRQRGSRIFQDMRVDQVIDQVLHAAGIPTRWNLTRTYPVRDYITQYKESDLAFVQRLIAEAGIFFTFGGHKGAADALLDAASAPIASVVEAFADLAATAAASVPYPTESIVFGDDASVYPTIAMTESSDLGESVTAAVSEAAGLALGGAASNVGAAQALSFMSVDGLATHRSDKVTHFESTRSARSDVAEYREFDPTRPSAPLSSRVGAGAGFISQVASTAAAQIARAQNDPLSAIGSFGKGAIAEALLGLVAQRQLETYEHHGSFLLPDFKDVEGIAARIRSRMTRKRVVAEGRSGCPALAAGHRFRLEDHPLDDHNGEHVVVSIEHGGDVAKEATVYECSFTAAPASVTYALSPRRRQTTETMVTATVVGPPGEDIYVDPLGRIKVRFHWDRRDPSADSTCWIRTAHPWAGTGFGHQFIPRVGMEVIILFDGSDPDKPYVHGCVYNGTHPVPYKLPDERTKSGIRTQSVPGGVGYNELMFEDALGRERVYVQAERDFEKLVKHNMSTNVLHDESRNVGHDQTIAIAETRRLDVGKDVIERVGENHSEQVGGSKTTEIKDTRRLSVGGDDYENVHGARTVAVDKRLSVQVGEHCGIMAGDDKTPATVDAYSWGSITAGAERRVVINAKEGILLVCGDSVIEINKEGISLNAGKLNLEATKSLTAAGKGPALVLDEKAVLTAKSIQIISKKASIVLDEEAKIDGQQVKLNCKGLDPDARDANGKKRKTKKLSILPTDANLVPYSGKEYVVTAGGASFEGVTAGDGKLEEMIPDEATHAEVVLFLGERPEGPKQRYSVRLEEIPDVGTVRGALIRMRNLGYWWSDLRDEHDPLVASVLKEFQAENGLKATGDLDADTVAKLRELHGH